jgi:hypothetical protein
VAQVLDALRFVKVVLGRMSPAARGGGGIYGLQVLHNIPSWELHKGNSAASRIKLFDAKYDKAVIAQESILISPCDFPRHSVALGNGADLEINSTAV